MRNTWVLYRFSSLFRYSIRRIKIDRDRWGSVERCSPLLISFEFFESNQATKHEQKSLQFLLVFWESKGQMKGCPK
jgi:hypothetical protein